MSASFDPSRNQRVQVVIFSALLSLFALADRSVAGQQAPSGIVGVVTDESGGVLPGVTVTATSPALQIPSVTVLTDEHGEYRLTPLPIGTFTVEFTLSGFQGIRREGIVLPVAFVAKIDMQLKVGSLAETVTVSGASPVVDVVSSSSSTVLTKEVLNVVPSSRNGTVSLLAYVPGVRPAIDIGGALMTSGIAFHAFGQDNQPWQEIEGVLVSAAKNTAQAGIYWDYSMIDEVKAATFGSAAEVGTRGVVVSGVVKSGGNDFHGSGFFAFQNGGLQSTNVDDKLQAQGLAASDKLDSRTDTSGDFSGRLIRNKLWFYGGTRRRTQRSDTLQCLQPSGEHCYSYDYQIFNTQKISWQINESNRLIGFQNYARKITMGSGSRLTAWESRSGQILPSHIEKVEWQRVKGNSLMIDILAADMHWFSHFRGYGYGKVLKTDSVLGTTTGMSLNDGENPDDYNHQPFRGSVTWYKPDLFLGNHDIKIGGDYFMRKSDRWRESRDRTWIWAQKFNSGNVPANTDSGNYSLQFVNGVANRVTVFNYPAIPVDFERLTNVYAQDSWRTGRLTLNLGVRYAHDNGFAPERCRQAALPPGDVAFPAQCFAKVQMKIFDSVVPRLHAAYDPLGDGKTVIKGGWGRFMFMRYTDQTQHANWNQPSQAIYIWHDLNRDGDYQPGEVNLDPNGPDFLQINQAGGGETVRGVPNPNEKQSGTDEFSVSVERELLPNVAVRVTGVYSRTFNFQRLQNNKRPYEVYTTPITNPIPGTDGKLETGPGTFITYYDYPAAYAGVRNQEPMIINDSRANQTWKSFEVALSRRLANRWHFYASYSLTQKHMPFLPNTGGGSFLNINTYNPNSEINNDDNTKEWLGRIQGSYIFPYGVTVAADYENRSGDPQQRTAIFTGGRQIPQITLAVEPLGAKWRLPNVNLVNLNVQKTFPVRTGQTATARINIYNALNTNPITGRIMASGPNFGLPTGVLLPRVAELSVSYNF